MEKIGERPLVSVVMPTYETQPGHLREAVASVRAQTYEKWELCIVDDGSTRTGTRRAIDRAASRDPRIKARFLGENMGISAATNAGLELGEGELVAFLDHDDLLTPNALERMADAFIDGAADIAYSDQDKVTATGEMTDRFLKPDWSPVYALGAMYIGHLLMVRRALVDEVGGLDPQFDTIQDFELLLRLSERTERICHIPEILYRWRAIPGSIALGESEKPGVTELQARAVNSHLRRRGIAGEAVPHPTLPHRLRLRPAGGSPRPSVSVVVPEREGTERALAALERTDHPDLEVLLEPSEGSFHPALLANRGAKRAGGDYLAFLGEGVTLADPNWVEQLLLYACIPGVGAVGPTLAHPDGKVAAAGIAIGLYDPAVPVMRGFPVDADGYYGSLACAREASAVGMDCMLVRRELFEELGGFEQAYRRQFHDFDLCLRLAERGLSTICAPEPRAVSHVTEARLRSDFDVLDRALFVDRWYERLEVGDPFYNRGFFREAADYIPSPFGADELELAMSEAAR